MFWKKNFWLLFLLAQIAVVQVLSFWPETVERYYSRGIYPIISSYSRLLLDFFSVSVGDVLYLILLFYLLVKFFKIRRKLRENWRVHLQSVCRKAAVLYLLFMILWGLNYNRVPLHEKMGVDQDYTTPELLSFTRKLITHTNALQHKITGNTSTRVVLPANLNTTAKDLKRGFDKLAKTHPDFSHDGYSLKQSLISYPLTYMGFSGYLNPFTNEAQVNYKLPHYSYPATAAHEMAHQIGFASESEANFIGYLATVHHPNNYISYSGYCMAVRYCLAVLKNTDEDSFNTCMAQLHEGVLKNFKETEIFWAEHETIIEKGFHLFYDHFLKWNNQRDGMEGYKKFVNLLVNYYQNKPFPDNKV